MSSFAVCAMARTLSLVRKMALGRSRKFGHIIVMMESSTTPTISFDYAFLNDSDEVETPEAYEAVGESAEQLLVVRDDKSKAIFGHVVPSKGS